MALIAARPDIDLRVSFTINEAEARALDALVGYGDDAFIQAFKEKLGMHYMRDHEEGLRLFLQSIRELMPAILYSVDKARAAFVGQK